MNDDEGKIFSILRNRLHYYFHKGIISDKIMKRSISKLSFSQNPFLWEELQNDLEKNISKKRIHYDWSNFEGFDAKLDNDD